MGEKIRRLRLLNEINQQELADAANISLDAVRNIESGKGSSLHTLIRIARALERTDWLESLCYEDEPSPSERWRDKMLKKPRQRAARNRHTPYA